MVLGGDAQRDSVYELPHRRSEVSYRRQQGVAHGVAQHVDAVAIPQVDSEK
jgi:hypothetical protein